MDEKNYILGFSAFSGIGTRRFEQLLQHFGLAKNAWKAKKSELVAILKPAIGEEFDEFRKTFDTEKYAQEVSRKNIHWFIPTDKEYPLLLKQLPHPPFILFTKGNVELLSNDKTIGIVGTRKVTDYGRQVTEMFARELVQNNFTIVSGMALGVDGIAHQETLRNNGATIAVLGSGVDVPTPREHTSLYQEILDKNGLIISTFSPGETASKGSFPARNAIIAALSKGILVTEGAEDSGSLITAQYGKKFGRLIFAVPGQITSQLSKGTNSLIKNGAIPVGSAADILDSLGIVNTQKSDSNNGPIAQGTDEKTVLMLLQNGPLQFDEIVRSLGKNSQEVGTLLSLMELQGFIHQTKEGKYIL